MRLSDIRTVEGPTDGSLQVEIIADRDDSRWC
jgi:hypothetical protein